MWEKDSWLYATQDEKSFASDAEMGEIRRWSELLNIEDVTSYYTPPVEDEDPPSVEGKGDDPYVSDDDYGLNDIYQVLYYKK